MLAKHYLLASVFAGGCLSGAVLIGFMRGDTGTIPRDPPSARTAERYRERAPAYPTDDGPDVADVENENPRAASNDPTTPKKEREGESATETGSSIADILSQLEAAYRLGAAAAPAQPTTASTEAPPREIAAPREAVVAVAAPAAPPTNTHPAAASPAAASPARAPENEAPQRLASRDAVPPPDVNIGSVQQNTNVGSAHQGDVYVIQNAVPWIPFYALQPGMRYPSTVRNRDNPRGFTYPVDGVFNYPIELVH